MTRLTIRLSDAENARLERLAKARGEKMSATLRAGIAALERRSADPDAIAADAADKIIAMVAKRLTPSRIMQADAIPPSRIMQADAAPTLACELAFDRGLYMATCGSDVTALGDTVDEALTDLQRKAQECLDAGDDLIADLVGQDWEGVAELT